MTDDQFQAAVDEAVAMEHANQKLASLERLRRSVVRERLWQRILTCLSIVVAGAAIVLAVVANGSLDRFESERASRSRGSCVQYNEQQERSREGNKTQLRVVITGLTAGRTVTPEGQAQLDALYTVHDAAMDAAFPDRVCTPEGIEAYLRANR